RNPAGPGRARGRGAPLDSTPDADDASRRVARTVLRAVQEMSRTIDTHVDELGRMDAVAGDGDHGIGMQRGAHAALR
ncbi:MAG: D-erythrulose kinase, partial [Microbacterium aurantiacum]